MKDTKILIVEDNEDLNYLYRIAFENIEFDVQTSHDGDDGIKKALHFKPDLMLLDLSIPKKDGFEVLDHIYDKLPDTTFVLNSAVYSPILMRQKTGKLDRVRFLEKPMKIEDTVSSVLEFLKGDTDRDC